MSVLVFVSRDFELGRKLRCHRKIYSSNLSEICYRYVGRGSTSDARRYAMPYGPIQGQGHVALKVRNSSILKISLVK